MSLHLTPDMLEASYELLRTTRPFRAWRLPAGDDVEFHVYGGKDRSADYTKTATGHRIRVNANWCGTLEKLIRAMAHEMCHMHLAIDCPGDQAHHGKRFQACAARVCAHHVFDLKAF